ncbi:MAG TPA: 5-methyltetrahydropteroyltriglutamate--homocysteine S-methyltransferase [Exilispira sp.]|nr:5-methyltetrahydropteroyltriglutamate--homocysteine S-methyltransferase [Exilispira sp.]
MNKLIYGYPKLGEKNEFKKITEAFFDKLIDEKTYIEKINEQKLKYAKTILKYSDYFVCNDFSAFDFMLDVAIMTNITKSRFGDYQGLSTYFEAARGENSYPLKKWFNTNYHYLCCEISDREFSLSQNIILDDFLFYKKNGVESTASVVAPFTFLTLSDINEKLVCNKIKTKNEKVIFENISDSLVDVYNNILKELEINGCKSIIFYDPALVYELSSWQWDIVERIYNRISTKLDIYLFTFYESVDCYDRFIKLPVDGFGFDLVSNEKNLENILNFGFPGNKKFFAGIVDGRNIFKSNIEKKANIVELLSKKVNDLIITNSCPLFHLPITKYSEKNMDRRIFDNISFAEQRAEELCEIQKYFNEKTDSISAAYEEFDFSNTFYKNKENQIQKPSNIDQNYVDDLAGKIEDKKVEDFDLKREKRTDYKKRKEIQDKIFKLPLYPTTTIGSFPQTQELRKLRYQYKKGIIDRTFYRIEIYLQIKNAIELQEKLGLDVLVHGEFERSDMVEYFAQKLGGITTTENGWILSYGTRVYRPPIIFGDVRRTQALTIEEYSYAQCLTEKPVKAILTGPITISHWSYVLDNLTEQKVLLDLAVALNEEIRDLEKIGAKIIQIDEPAFRESAPVKKSNWNKHFNFASEIFNITSFCKDETQIHTHMCYSDFSEIISYIDKMDFDVISIEAARTQGKVAEEFKKIGFNRQIGIGVFDVHTPEVASYEKIKNVVDRVTKIFPAESIWINPDCGLKTRKWDEVIPSLSNMVEVAKSLRENTENRGNHENN